MASRYTLRNTLICNLTTGWTGIMRMRKSVTTFMTALSAASLDTVSKCHCTPTYALQHSRVVSNTNSWTYMCDVRECANKWSEDPSKNELIRQRFVTLGWRTHCCAAPHIKRKAIPYRQTSLIARPGKIFPYWSRRDILIAICVALYSSIATNSNFVRLVSMQLILVVATSPIPLRKLPVCPERQKGVALHLLR